MNAQLAPAEIGTIRVLDPTAEPDADTLSRAPRLPTLQGTVVGFLDNKKHNFALFCDELGSLLKEEYGVAEVRLVQKAHSGTPAPPEMVADLLSRCDAVVAGSAD